MKYAILGAGAMGCLIATGLKRGGGEVHLVDPYEAHMNAITEKGLDITIRESSTGEKSSQNVMFDSATTDGNGVGVCDCIIVLVKGVNTRKMVAEHTDLIGSDTVAVTLQNGIGNIDILQEFFPENRIIGGVLKCGSSLVAPGVVAGTVSGGRVTDLYYMPCEQGERISVVAKDLEKTMTVGGITSTLETKLEAMIWDKLYLNAMCNIPCAVMHVDLEDAFRNSNFAPILRKVGEEVCSVATAKGFPMDADKLWNEFAIPMTKHPEGMRNWSSACQDSMRKVHTEIEFLTGAVVREGKKVGVSTPYNELFLSLGRAMEDFYPCSSWKKEDA